MWKLSRASVLFLVLVVTNNTALAQADERAAVLAVMQQAFAAVTSGDPDDFRAIQLAEGNTLSFRQVPGGEPGSLLMRMTGNEAGLENLKYDGREYLERWIGEPTVLIRGPIALVWGEYDFWIDGKFSHCGVDSVQLAKVDEQWKIANWAWTVEKSDCPAQDE